MKRLLTFLFLTCTLQGFSQSFTQAFEGNNFRWHQNTNGLLFFNQEESEAGLEVPVGESNHTIFVTALWFGGINEQDELKMFSRRFCQNESDGCEGLWGPLKPGADPNSPDYSEGFNRFWFVSIEEVLEHNQYFECVQDPNCDVDETFPNSYEVPEAFLSWPAHGDTLLGYDFYLAPFFDNDNNGIYNPESGDHPIFCGDFATYLVTNDVGNTDFNQDAFDIGIEIHSQVYGYNSQSGSLFNTLFVQQKIINRGNQNLSGASIASWADFDIGNPNDDRIGTDVQRSMFYAYNGDPTDEESTVGPGYGTDLPAMGIRFLAGPFADSDDLDNTLISDEYNSYANQTFGYNDGIIDNERLGLYAAMFHNNSSGPTFSQDPQIPIHYYNYMNGQWRNGVPMTFGGIGFDPDGTPLQARYFVPGISDPLLEGTSGIDPNYPFEGGWTEENEGFQPADRRMLGSSGPFTFAPGEVQYLDYAYIFARESFDENETVIETLQRYADEIVGMECGQLPSITLSAKFKEASKLGIEIFPNPAQNLVNFRFAELYKNIEIEIRDLNGRLVSHNRYGMINQVEQEVNFAPGVYIVRVFADDKVGTSKLVISE